MSQFRVCLFIILVWAISLPCQSQDNAQPKVLKHWSAYNYPTELPSDARVHIVIKHDTLWDLAAKYYGNPLVWPQIHEANSYVTDPDLIYPGDPLILPNLKIIDQGKMRGAKQDQDVAPASSDAGNKPAGPINKDGKAFSLNERVMFEVEPRQSDKYTTASGTFEMYCCPVVYREKVKPELWIAGTEEIGQIEIQPYDIVYINRGKGYVEAGDYLIAMNYVEPVYRPSDGGFVGHGYYEVGLLKVHLAMEEVAVAEVITACDGMNLGSLVYHYEERPIPVVEKQDRKSIPVRYTHWSEEEIGEIVWSHYDTLTLSTGDLFCLEMNSPDEYKVGDQVALFVRSKLHQLYDEKRGDKINWVDEDGNPVNEQPETGYIRNKYHVAHVEGFAVVLRTTDVVAVMKMIHTSRVLGLGDSGTDYDNRVVSENQIPD